MPENQSLTGLYEDMNALPLSGRLQSDADFENLSRWIDGRLSDDDGGILEWHVVLADDDAANRMVLSSLLEKSGITVTAVENGRRALDVIGGKPVDLFLLDINMPEMDGLQTARAIRPCTTPIPTCRWLRSPATCPRNALPKCAMPGLMSVWKSPCAETTCSASFWARCRAASPATATAHDRPHTD
ncbi:MAG: response regulator [Rhodospirillales bacterium]